MISPVCYCVFICSSSCVSRLFCVFIVYQAYNLVTGVVVSALCALLHYEDCDQFIAEIVLCTVSFLKLNDDDDDDDDDDDEHIFMSRQHTQ